MTDHLHPADEPTPEDLLASAFVDGDVTPEEAAVVQASPELQARALSYLHLRADLADMPDVGEASAQQRELAITAALHEFDTLHAATSDAPAAAASPVAPVVHLTARTVWAKRVLAAAAAIAVVGVAGVVVFGGNDGARDNSAARTADSQLSTESQDLAGGTPQSTIGSISGSADYAVTIDSSQQLHDLPLPQVAPTAAPTASDAGTAESAPAPKDIIGGAQCLTATQVFLAKIVYQGTPAIAVRDTVSGVTQAIDEQCNVLVEVAP